MALAKKPVNGMKDILPEEMQVRDYVMGVIKETYRSFGFTPIETPCMENIGNLSNKQGGENEKLIFKVLKRGEKLNLEAAQTEEDVVDFGMRYDLTVPLARFYSNNANSLPSPFPFRTFWMEKEIFCPGSTFFTTADFPFSKGIIPLFGNATFSTVPT